MSTWFFNWGKWATGSSRSLNFSVSFMENFLFRLISFLRSVLVFLFLRKQCNLLKFCLFFIFVVTSPLSLSLLTH